MRNHAKPPGVGEPTPLAHKPEQAAKRLGIGQSTLYKLIRKKKIHAVKCGVRTLVPESELQRFLKEGMEQST